MPSFAVGGRNSGETLKLEASARTTLEAKLTWTFPMAFAEVITGNGKTVQRTRIDLADTSAYGERTLKTSISGLSFGINKAERTQSAGTSWSQVRHEIL